MVKSSGKKSRGPLNYLVKNWPTLITFAIIYTFILQFFGSYMLTKTTTTGGDLGSHWILAQYLRDYLVPHGKLIGWYPHWMGGLPILQYYFVPPYFLMVLLSPFITLEIAFKLVSAAWIFFTPIAFYYAAKGLGFEKPGPEIAAALSLGLTWLETVSGGNYAQWGGNVKSAMAGQFTYGLSIAFTALCLGMLWEGYHSKKRITLNAVVFSMVVLHHLYTTIAVGLASTYFIWHALKNRKFDGVFYLAKVFILGFMIAGFWLIPSVAKLGWSSPPRDVFYGLPSMDWVFIQEYTVFYIIIILGFSLSLMQYLRKSNSLKNTLLIYLADLAITFSVVHMINTFFFKNYNYNFYFGVAALLLTLQASIVNKENRVIYCLYAFFLILIQIFTAQVTNLLYARFIPVIFIIYLLITTKALLNLTGFFRVKSLIPIIITLLLIVWMAVGVDDLLNLLVNSSLRDDYQWYKEISYWVSNFKPGGKYQWYVSHGIKDAPSWLKWNYEGLEVKPAWPGVKELYNYTSHLPLKGRINYEYYDYGKLATARIFEASPAFTNKSVMESLLVESSTTFPFFYYMQKTVSETSWWPGFPIKIPTVINLKHGKDIFWVYNVQYYIVYSQTIKALIKNQSDYHYITTIGTPASGEFEIYSVNEDSHYADVPPREPILVLTDYWRPFSFKWFDVTDLDVPVAFKSDVDDYDLEHFRIIVVNKTIDFKKRPNTVVYTSDQFLEAVNASKRLDYNCVISDAISEELLLINDSCVGKPLWIKIPYFPNWKTYETERIYFATPNLMLVFPNKERVTLYYAWLPSDILGYIVTIIALIVVVYSVLLSSETFNNKFHRKLLSKMEEIHSFKKLLQLPPKIEKGFTILAEKTIVILGKNKWKVIVVLILLWFGLSTLNYNSRASLCSSHCVSKGYPGYDIPPFGNVIDNYDMGANNEKENILRNLKCTAVCDPSRKDYVYVSGGGYVEFLMYLEPMADNILSIRAIDNQNCRQDDVYMDGQYIGQIYGIGEVGQRSNFDLPLPRTNKSVVRIRIYHNRSKTDCYGFDVFSNQIKIPECTCLNAFSSAQSREWVLINLMGAISIIIALSIVAYSLTSLNKTLRVRVHDKVKVRIRASEVYKIKLKFTVLIREKIRKFRIFIQKNKKFIILIIIVAIAIYFAVQYTSRYLQMQHLCSLECQDGGFKEGYAPSNIFIDEFKLGADNAAEYPKHNFTCTAVCDEQRKNYVYASGGKYIEFDMALEPNVENILIISAGNYNELCRQNDIYVNDKFVGEILQLSGAVPESDYEIKLPIMNASKIRVRIDHNLSRTQCWGHDVFQVKTQLPRCICK